MLSFRKNFLYIYFLVPFLVVYIFFFQNIQLVSAACGGSALDLCDPARPGYSLSLTAEQVEKINCTANGGDMLVNCLDGVRNNIGTTQACLDTLVSTPCKSGFDPNETGVCWIKIEGQEQLECEETTRKNCQGISFENNKTCSKKNSFGSSQTSVSESATRPFVAPNLKSCPDGRGSCTLIDNPLASRGTDIYRQVGGVVGYVLLLIGSITLLMIVWGGFQWLTAAGNAEKIEQGSKTMLWAVLGVVAVFVSYIFLNNFLDYVTGAT